MSLPPSPFPSWQAVLSISLTNSHTHTQNVSKKWSSTSGYVHNVHIYRRDVSDQPCCCWCCCCCCYMLCPLHSQTPRWLRSESHMSTSDRPSGDFHWNSRKPVSPRNWPPPSSPIIENPVSYKRLRTTVPKPKPSSFLLNPLCSRIFFRNYTLFDRSLAWPFILDIFLGNFKN